MNWLTIAPLINCILLIILLLFTWQNIKLQKYIHLIGSLTLLFIVITLSHHVWKHSILTMQIGSWPTPFGITFVADKLSALMLLITTIINLAVAVYSIIDINKNQQHAGYFTVYWVLILGVCGSFLTGDLFNLYVWFEVMLIASFVLMNLGSKKSAIDGTLKYVIINLVATSLLLSGIALLYGLTGTLNMADLAVKISTNTQHNLVTALALLLTLAFAIKAALFPVFSWLPASYPTTAVSTSALFAGLLTKVGVYALIRMYTLIFPHTPYAHKLLLILAVLTMVVGVLGAIIQYDFRRLLSFHIISQIGYMVLGLAISTQLALAACLFYFIHHMLVKTNLFLISGLVQRTSNSFNLLQSGSLYRYYPLLTVLFFIPAFSLAGLPPFSGFWAKLLTIQAAMNSKQLLVAIIALLVSLFTLYSMVKIWCEAFWKRDPNTDMKPIMNISKWQYATLLTPIALLACLTLAISFWPVALYNLASTTTVQLLNPQLYIQMVMKNG